MVPYYMVIIMFYVYIVFVFCMYVEIVSERFGLDLPLQIRSAPLHPQHEALQGSSVNTLISFCDDLPIRFS